MYEITADDRYFINQKREPEDIHFLEVPLENDEYSNIVKGFDSSHFSIHHKSSITLLLVFTLMHVVKSMTLGSQFFPTV